MSDRNIYSPFKLKILGMKHLLLVNIEKDPDEIYTSFEPQSFDEGENGKGIRVLAYRKDGYVDLYQENSLKRNEEDKLSVAGKGLGDFVEVNLEKSKFVITEYGADLHLIFIDKLGRKINIKIVESKLEKTKPFDLLAPVGISSENPISLPVFFMYGFYFVRRKGTEVLIQIDNKIHKPDKFIIPIDGKSMYFMRYATTPLIGEFNLAESCKLKPLKIEGDKFFSEEGVIYTFDKINDKYVFKTMSLDVNNSELNIEFIPPIKEITSLDDGENNIGEFIISGRKSVGTIGGEYSISRVNEDVNITIIPTKGWEPNENRTMIKLIYFLAKPFKQWPKTYKWTANIKLDKDKWPSISSKWERIKGVRPL
ncbi:MAG: hypothetical protein ACRDA5_08890 [Clostridium sp.]